jgi:hypothetical protein
MAVPLLGMKPAVAFRKGAVCGAEEVINNSAVFKKRISPSTIQV